MKRRILTLMMSICMVCQFIPVVNTAHAAGGYNPKENSDFIIPGALRNNRDFMMGTALRGTQANFVNKMGLNGNSSYKDFEVNNTVELDPASMELRSKGQLSYTYAVRTKNSRDIANGCKVYTRVYLNGQKVAPSHTNRNSFESYGLYADGNTLQKLYRNYFKLHAITSNETWYTKATQTKDLAIYLVDTYAPTVENCEITQDGNKVEAVQLGSTIRFTLNFSEYIRFADNSAENKPGLQFEILPSGDMITDPIKLKADFVELYDNKIVFEYTFQEEYSSHKGIKEFYISRIEKVTQQEDLNKTYTLVTVPESVHKAANVPEMTVNNLITDLAGNAVEEVLVKNDSGVVTGEREIQFNRVLIDSKAPSVSSVGIEKKPTSTLDDGSVIPYAKTNDKIDLSVSFDEAVYAAAGSVTATLNIMDGSGNPVTVKNTSDLSGDTIMKFDQFTITEDMTYTGGAAEEGKITIASIDATAVLDIADNSCGVRNLKDEGIYANRDFALDTAPPVINIDLEPVSPITTFDDESIFCVPFSIGDDDSNGSIAVSGIDNRRGYFYLTGFPIQYAYESNQKTTPYEKQYFSYYVSNMLLTEAELSDKWITAHESFATDLSGGNMYYFEQYSGGGTYIYIKIGNSEITNPTIHILAEDIAGNTNTISRGISYIYDTTEPEFGKISEVTMTANQNDTYDLSCEITCTDENGIDVDSLRISSADGAISNLGLGTHSGPYGDIDITRSESEDGGKTYTIGFIMKAVPADTIVDHDLIFEISDTKGNVNSAQGQFYYNLTSFPQLRCEKLFQNENGYSSFFEIRLDWDHEFTDKARTIFMIKDPFSSDNGYAVTIVDGSYMYNDNILIDPDLAWSYYKRSENASAKKQILLEPAEGDTSFFEDVTKASGYFGDINYVMISGDDITIDNFTNNEEDVVVPISITEETFRIGGAADAVQGESLGVSFDYEPVDWELDPVSGIWTPPQYGEDGIKIHNTSLAGKVIKVKLSLPKWENTDKVPDFKWSDVESVILKLRKCVYDDTFTTDANDNPIFEIPLSLTEEEQMVVLPEYLDSEYFTEDTTLEFYTQTRLKSGSVFSYGIFAGNDQIFTCRKLRDEPYLEQVEQTDYVEDLNGELISVKNTQEFSSAEETSQNYGVAKTIKVSKSDMSHINLSFSVSNIARVRVWNEELGETKDDAEWSVTIFNMQDHLIDGKINVIKYQTLSAYNGLSEEHTLLFDVNSQPPTLDIGFTPDADEGYVEERVLTINQLSSSKGDELTVKMIDPDGNIVDFPEGEDAVIRDSETRLFYTMDSWGAVASVAVKAEKLDREAPVINIENQDGAHLGISIKDDVFESDLTDMEGLYIRYDDETYTDKLREYGLSTDEEGFFKVEEFNQQEYGVRPENTGMGILEYSGSAWIADEKLNADITFTAPKGSGGYSGGISMYVIDRVGHKSEIVTATELDIPEIQYDDVEFFYSRDTYPFGPDGNMFSPYFGVRMSEPAEYIEPGITDRGIRGEIYTENTFNSFIEALPVYKDGVYSLKLRDYFGDVHDVSYTVPAEAFDGDRIDVYAVNAKDGDTDIVNLNISSLDGNKFRVELPSADDYNVEAMEGYIIDPLMKAGEATVRKSDGSEGQFGEMYDEVMLKVTKNGTFKVIIENNSGLFTEYLVNVYINREIAELEKEWSFPNGMFEDDEGNIYTYDYAEYIVKPVDQDRDLIGDTAFRFTYNDKIGTQKTFTVTDDYGFVQECTAELDFEIRRSGVVYLIAPDTEISVYAQRNGSNTLLGSIDENGRYKELISMYGGASGYSITASTTSFNNVKTVLLPYGADISSIKYSTAQNADIDGVEITDNIISVKKSDAQFSIVMVDEKDLLGERFDFDGGFVIDVSPPVVTDVKKNVKGYSVELEITVTDDVSSFDDITVISPAGVTRRDGKFIYNVGQNGTVVFVISDKCGNNATQVITVEEIDETKPTARIVAYSPSSETSKLALPLITNRDIEAFITFSKNIKEMGLEVLKDGVYVPVSEGDGVSLRKNTESSATVTFTKGASIRVTYEALNGQSGTPLEINVGDGVIDKTVPVLKTEINYNIRDGATKAGSANIVIYDESKTIYRGGGIYTKDSPFTETIYENNIYEYMFSDEAGNVVKADVNIDQLDMKRLELYAYDIPEQISPAGAEFKISVNKPSTITLDSGLSSSESLTVTEPDGKNITITAQNAGFYKISAEDDAGNIVDYYVSIAIGDQMPPTLVAESNYIYVRQGSDLAELTDEILLDGVIVGDDKTSTENIAFTIDRSQIPADLNTIGNYAYVITAADEAGNTSRLQRYVNVYPKDSTDVRIDNVFTKNTGVATTTVGEHTISVSLPESMIMGAFFEPYNVYCAKGFNTAGQMKPWMQPMTPVNAKNGVSDEYVYNFEQAGWYTVYILRENREAFIVHVLIQ